MTSGEYQKETERILMGDAEHPHWGYRPCELRERIMELLKLEKKKTNKQHEARGD